MIVRICYAILLTFSLPFLIFAQSGAIRGKVKERDGKMLDGVLVRAASASDAQQKHETKTNNRGEFELKGLAEGDYALSFELQGYHIFTTRHLTVAEGETVKLSRTIELVPERTNYAVIRGAIFTSEGLTLSNASVKVERISKGRRFQQETISRDGGEFAFRLPAEKALYRITATAHGFRAAYKELEIENDEIRQIALSLERIK